MKPDDKTIETLNEFPRIRDVVLSKWGTIYLRGYLYDLMNDTRGGTRKGFPFHILVAISKLSDDNEEILNSLGLGIEETLEFSFSPKTKLPKNF